LAALTARAGETPTFLGEKSMLAGLFGIGAPHIIALVVIGGLAMIIVVVTRGKKRFPEDEG
jgi:hypothetical protein